MALKVVLASAGAGKTHYLAEQALKELLLGRRVLAITFTRNAAAELRERILKLAQEQGHIALLRRLILGQAPLDTSTIDALVREVYYHLAPLLGLAAYEDLIVQEEDQIEVRFQLVEEVLRTLQQPGYWRAFRRALEEEVQESSRRLAIERYLARRIDEVIKEGVWRAHLRAQVIQWLSETAHTPQPLAEKDRPWLEAIAMRPTDKVIFSVIQKSLQAYRQKSQRLFLSDLVNVVQFIATTYGDLLAGKAGYYKALFVDEAQDTSPVQWRILNPFIKEISAQGGLVCLIGDPKQSIYAWREADYEMLLEFSKKGYEKYTLFGNYRSHPKVVAFNNKLYHCLPCLLETFYSNRRKNPPHVTEAIGVISKVYAESQQIPNNKDISSKEAVVEIIRIDPADPEKSRKEHLCRILQNLENKGVPPQETAFLVRRNDDINRLLGLLSDRSLQVQEIALGTCTSLVLTWRYLQGMTPVEEAFLASIPGEKRSSWVEALQALKSALESSEPPLRKWEAFYSVWKAIEGLFPTHKAFWMEFLGRVYSLLQQHPFYGIQALLRWWESKGQHILLRVPPAKGVYPVMTIHKAKGLAWEAVIIPFAEWSFMTTRWDTPRWRKVKASHLPSSLREELKGLEEFFSLSTLSENSTDEQSQEVSSEIVELPLKVSSEEEGYLSEIYRDYFVEQVLENLNLHYVATTRPRRYLYILAAPPRGNAQKGANTWAGFWNDPNLGQKIIDQDA